jgi:hypothetical protein
MDFTVNTKTHLSFLNLINNASQIKLSNLKIIDNSFSGQLTSFFIRLTTFIQSILKQFYEKMTDKELMNILEILYIMVSGEC